MFSRLRRSCRYLRLDAPLHVVAGLVLDGHTLTKYRNPRACVLRVNKDESIGMKLNGMYHAFVIKLFMSYDTCKLGNSPCPLVCEHATCL